MFEKILPELYLNGPPLRPRSRRKSLIDEMSRLDNIGNTCADCIGNCCTFSSNSMRISPIEAVDILSYLKELGKLDAKLIEKLRDCIAEFRLDNEFSLNIKKNYTCPFYKGSCQGCSISRGYKPYGCLAFNAISPNVRKGKDCVSNQKLLKARVEKFPEEDKMNKYIINHLGLTWKKASIPMALMEVIERANIIRPKTL